MEPHSIPRQITTFEFKLIGFLTIKQFLYIIFFAGLGFLIFLLIQIPYLNLILGVVVGSVGVAFAFIKINERPFDVWVRNLFIRLTTPSQYFYKKDVGVLGVFQAPPNPDPHVVNTHIDAQDKINKYLNIGKNNIQTPTPLVMPTETIHENSQAQDVTFVEPMPTQEPQQEAAVQDQPDKLQQEPTTSQKAASAGSTEETAYIKGTIENGKGIKLPNIMVYVKDKQLNSVRMLKTDARGAFALYRPLNTGEYILEARDLGNNYFFDTINFHITSPDIPVDLNLQSKEVV